MFKSVDKANRALLDIPQCDVVGENQIDVFFEGTFNQFAAFLNSLERHEPVIFVEQFKISRDLRDDTRNKVTMTLSVLVNQPQDAEDTALWLRRNDPAVAMGVRLDGRPGGPSLTGKDPRPYR